MYYRQAQQIGLPAGVGRREVSARELVDVALARIEAANPALNAFVAVDADQARADAREIDDRIVRGDDVGPLAGIPLAVKDTENAIGYRTSKGTRLLADAPPATSDSTLVERLRQAGCVVVGKTNTPELAWMADTDGPLLGRTGNPWSPVRSAGGSSGGSAAAIAAGMVPLATGSDGGGSLRIPASVCGLSVLKPSLGRIPVGPGLPDWADLSSKGVMTRSITDAALVLDTVLGPDPNDLRSLPMPEQSWFDALGELHLPRKVLWSATLGYAVIDKEIREVCERAIADLEDAGVEVERIDDVFDEDPAVPWLTTALLANARTFAALDPDGARRGEIEPALADMIDWAKGASSPTSVLEVQDTAHRLNRRLVELLHRAPILLTPTVAGQTPVGDAFGTVHGIEDANWVRFTYPFNLTRSPAGSVCAGFTSDGMPVGLQVVGPQHGDVAVLRMLAALEDLLQVDTVCPFEP
jgi:aspartyl-tRNA(Asn)/glutamyl-tRNA(Gln) amidotransferase subunit A